MIALFSDIQTRVTRRVIDLPSAVIAEVPKLINVALTKLQEKHDFKVMEQEIAAYTLVNTHALVSSIGGPVLTIGPSGTANVKKWRGEPWFLTYNEGAPKRMSWANGRESIWGSFDQGGTVSLEASFPSILLEEMADDLGNRGISVYPLPDGNSDFPDFEYRITIPAWRYVAQLVAAGDHNWFTDQPSGEEFLVRWAAGEAFALNWDFQKFGVLTAQAEIHYKDLVNADKRARLGAVESFVPHWRGAYQNRTRG